jgi:hypothetical protein
MASSRPSTKDARDANKPSFQLRAKFIVHIVFTLTNDVSERADEQKDASTKCDEAATACQTKRLYADSAVLKAKVLVATIIKSRKIKSYKQICSADVKQKSLKPTRHGILSFKQ